MRVPVDVRERAGKVVERASCATLVALAIVGIVVGHTLTYWAVAPEADHRETLLAATGHSYWGAAVSVAMVAAAGGLVAQVIRNVRFVLAHTRSAERAGFASRLVALQVAGFIVMEVTERMAAGEALTMRSLVAHGTLVLGVVVQVVVGLVIAGLIEWLGRTTRRLAERFTRRAPVRRPRTVCWPVCSNRVHATSWWRSCAIRGPPGLSNSLF